MGYMMIRYQKAVDNADDPSSIDPIDGAPTGMFKTMPTSLI